MLVSPISFIKVQPTDSSGGDNAAAKRKATEKKRRASRSHTASVTNSDSVKLAENILPRNFEGEGSLPSEAGTDSLKEPTSSIDMQEAIQEEVKLALAFLGSQMSQSMKERQIDEVIKDLANSSKAEELNKSTWGRGVMARALAKRAQSFARKDHEVNDFTMPEDRFERMQEMGRAHYAVHQTVDARDMETHIDSQMDDMRQSHDPDDSKDDASTFGARGRAFLLKEFERMVRAAIKIQRAFRKFAIKCKEKGVWPSDDKFRQAKGLIKAHSRYLEGVSTPKSGSKVAEHLNRHMTQDTIAGALASVEALLKLKEQRLAKDEMHGLHRLQAQMDERAQKIQEWKEEKMRQERSLPALGMYYDNDEEYQPGAEDGQWRGQGQGDEISLGGSRGHGYARGGEPDHEHSEQSSWAGYGESSRMQVESSGGGGGGGGRSMRARFETDLMGGGGPVVGRTERPPPFRPAGAAGSIGFDVRRRQVNYSISLGGQAGGSNLHHERSSPSISQARSPNRSPNRTKSVHLSFGGTQEEMEPWVPGGGSGIPRGGSGIPRGGSGIPRGGSGIPAVFSSGGEAGAFDMSSSPDGYSPHATVAGSDSPASVGYVKPFLPAGAGAGFGGFQKSIFAHDRFEDRDSNSQPGKGGPAHDGKPAQIYPKPFIPAGHYVPALKNQSPSLTGDEQHRGGRQSDMGHEGGSGERDLLLPASKSKQAVRPPAPQQPTLSESGRDLSPAMSSKGQKQSQQMQGELSRDVLRSEPSVKPEKAKPWVPGGATPPVFSRISGSFSSPPAGRVNASHTNLLNQSRPLHHHHTYESLIEEEEEEEESSQPIASGNSLVQPIGNSLVQPIGNSLVQPGQTSLLTSSLDEHPFYNKQFFKFGQHVKQAPSSQDKSASSPRCSSSMDAPANTVGGQAYAARHDPQSIGHSPSSMDAPANTVGGQGQNIKASGLLRTTGAFTSLSPIVVPDTSHIEPVYSQSQSHSSRLVKGNISPLSRPGPPSLSLSQHSPLRPSPSDNSSPDCHLDSPSTTSRPSPWILRTVLLEPAGIKSNLSTPKPLSPSSLPPKLALQKSSPHFGAAANGAERREEDSKGERPKTSEDQREGRNTIQQHRGLIGARGRFDSPATGGGTLEELSQHHTLDPSWSYEGLPLPEVGRGEGGEGFAKSGPDWTIRIAGLVPPMTRSSMGDRGGDARVYSGSGSGSGPGQRGAGHSILDAPLSTFCRIQGARASLSGSHQPLPPLNSPNAPTHHRFSEAGAESYTALKPIGGGNLLSTVQQIVSRPPQQFVARTSISGSSTPKASHRLRAMISDAGEDLGGGGSVNLDEILAFKRCGL